MATIDSLALELLSEIFGHLVIDWERSHLCAPSLVCRRWRDPAQRALFQDVVLRSEESAGAWLQSPGRQRYRTTSLTIADEEWYGNGHTPIEILEACPDLRSLTLGSCIDGGHEWCSSAHTEGLNSFSIAYPLSFPIDAGPLTARNLRHLDLRLAPYADAFGAIFDHSRRSLLSICLGFLHHIGAAALVEYFAEMPFPLVRHLALDCSQGIQFWPKLILSFQSLVTLEIYPIQFHDNAKEAVAAVGASVVATLQNLIFTSIRMDECTIAELLRIIRLPNLAGLRRLEIARVSKDELAGEAGLALLDECEERSISLLCRYGWMTRDMMEEASPPRARN